MHTSRKSYLARTLIAAGAVLIGELTFTSTARADLYFEHLRNENLRAQLASQPWRLLPQTERFNFAVDTYLFKPWGMDHVYYHGSGYWVNVYGEARPIQDITLNLKVATYNGASSFGYARANFLQPYFGLTWHPSFIGDGWDVRFRFGDLDRVTFGTGLLLQDKEINGFALSVAKGDFRYAGVIDGTGAYYLPGDTYYQSLDWRANLLGLSLMFINYDGDRTWAYPTTQEPYIFPEWGHPAVTLFSQHPLGEGWSYQAEAGVRNRKVGAMTSVTWGHEKPNQWSFAVHGQVRYYEQGFADQIAGLIQQEYVTPEILDKDFTDARNILTNDETIWVTSARMIATYWPLNWLELGSSEELYRFHYVQDDFNNVGIFFKDTASLCPYAGNRKDCLSVYTSNVELNEFGPVFASSFPTTSFVKDVNYGFEAFVYF